MYQQLSTFARKHGYVIASRPIVPPKGGFKGATVLDPLRGFYKGPVSTLDFASLYPSIMISRNQRMRLGNKKNSWKQECLLSSTVHKPSCTQIDRSPTINIVGAKGV